MESTLLKCRLLEWKNKMDCAAREGIQFSDSNGVRRLPAAKGSKKPTILVVDDEVASGQVLSVRLKLAGFRFRLSLRVNRRLEF